MAIKLHRRALLKGIGGVALAMPMLDAMLNSHGTAFADATPIPKRYIVCFGGHSLGFGYNDPNFPDEYYRPNTPRDMFVPDKMGPGYDLKTALKPLGDLGVQDLVSVVSGLRIPYAETPGGMAPPGGMNSNFHYYNMKPLLTGMRADSQYIESASSDQIVADAIAGDTAKYFKSLQYCIQAANYTDSNSTGGQALSFRPDGSALNPTTSPAAAYASIFNGFVPQDPEQRKQFDLRMRQQKSILDQVQASNKRLLAKLGKADQLRLQAHLDEIRSLELRLGSQVNASAACAQLKIPTDPPIGGTTYVSGSGMGTADVSGTKGWSDEDTRSKLFADLIAMAMTCDLTRVATLAITEQQSFLSMLQYTGIPVEVHGFSHFDGGSVERMSLGIQWHVKQYSYLVSKLRDLMDYSAVVYTCEGGVGRMMESLNGAPGPHSTENMACLVAGRAGGLKAGQHIAATGMHPANVLLSAMSAVGAPNGNTLGEVNGIIPALFG